MEYFIGLDVGTSSVKGVLMSCEGTVAQCKTRKHRYEEADGLKVLDADAFCENCFTVIKELTDELSKDDKVLGVCASGASGNLMLVKDGKSNSPVYGWQNEFNKDLLGEGFAQLTDVYTTTGWPKLNSFPLATLLYIKENNPQKIADSDMFCMHIEYLNFKLTGKWGITPSMGTPFYLIDQESGAYKQEYLDLIGITKEQVPPIVPMCSVLGGVTPEAAEKTGLLAGTPIVAGTFDHPSAARGAGVFDENAILISCGTSWVVFMPFSDRSKPQSRKILTDPFMAPKGNWCGMKSLTSVSQTIDKYTETYLGEVSYSEFDALADAAPLGANGLVIDSCDVDVSGFERTDIARAIMESIARRLDRFLKDLEVDASVIKLVGGITNSAVWCRVISEVTGKQVAVVNGEHAGAVGSAIMAGVGAGVYPDEKTAFHNIYNA